MMRLVALAVLVVVLLPIQGPAAPAPTGEARIQMLKATAEKLAAEAKKARIDAEKAAAPELKQAAVRIIALQRQAEMAEQKAKTALQQVQYAEEAEINMAKRTAAAIEKAKMTEANKAAEAQRLEAERPAREARQMAERAADEQNMRVENAMRQANQLAGQNAEHRNILYEYVRAHKNDPSIDVMVAEQQYLQRPDVAARLETVAKAKHQDECRPKNHQWRLQHPRFTREGAAVNPLAAFGEVFMPLGARATKEYKDATPAVKYQVIADSAYAATPKPCPDVPEDPGDLTQDAFIRAHP